LTDTLYKAGVAEGLKSVLYRRSQEEARTQLNQWIAQFESKAAQAIKCLENGFEDATAAFALPEKYRERLHTTNMQERRNEEVRRRERVIRISPNEHSAKRLIGCIWICRLIGNTARSIELYLQQYWDLTGGSFSMRYYLGKVK
jgi:transposase-like protein